MSKFIDFLFEKTPPSSITDQETGKELFSRTLVSLIGTQEIKGKKHHIQKEDSSAVLSKVAVIVQVSLLRHQIIVFFSLSVSREEEKRADNNYLVTQQAYLYNDCNLGKHRGRILFLNVMFFSLYFLRPNN